MYDVLSLVGRVLFAFLFIGSGINHFKNLQMLVGYAQYKKLPLAKPAVLVSGLAFLLGGLSVALGVLPYWGALAIGITLLPTAFIFHNYWTETDAQAKQNEQMAFTKDLALAGAALALAAYLHHLGTNIPFVLFLG